MPSPRHHGGDGYGDGYGKTLRSPDVDPKMSNIRRVPTHLFSQPAVAEVIGAGFDRPANARYSTLRFPRIVKTHHDRSPGDVVDFDAYQRMAQMSCETLEYDDGENEYHSWLAKLGHDCIDMESEAATVSRGSEVQDSVSQTEDSHNVYIGARVRPKATS